VIDVHAHVGHCQTTRWLGTDDPEEVLDRAAAVGIDLSILSHLDALYHPARYGRSANLKLLKFCERRRDARMWWVVDPRARRSVDLFRQHAQHPQVMGLKIGPTYHHYRFAQCARTILELAMQCDAAVLSHSGEPNDMPGDIVPWLNRYPQVRFIIAHFGNCRKYTGHRQALQRCTSPNCFVDTSSAVSMVCDHLETGVRQLGARRFLFGTDAPLYSTAAQLARILEADLPARDKRAILGENAERFLLRKKD
jgi:predicted TIM-barrel fold metal-dependent hydrolase